MTGQTKDRARPLRRQLAERYADLLFPGVPREAALRLHRMLLEQPAEKCERGDGALLRQMAVASARAAGLDARAFTRTPRYRLQQAYIRRCSLRRHACLYRACMAAKRLLRAPLRPAAQTSFQVAAEGHTCG